MKFISYGTQGNGSYASPFNAMPTKFEAEDNQLAIKQGYSLPKRTIPANVAGFHLMPYAITGGRPKVRLNEVADPKPAIAGLTSLSEIVAHNIRFDGSVDITVRGTAGAKEKDDKLKTIVLVNCEIMGDLNLSGCEMTMVVLRNCFVSDSILIEGVKGGRVHLQETECRDIVTDDETTTELICGSTDIDKTSKHYGKALDCCKYRSIKHKTGKALPTAFLAKKKEYGTGKKVGKIEKPEFTKSQIEKVVEND